MGRHAAPRTSSSVARRATAVSAGALVLCLGAAAPAVAATSPINPPPIPKPVTDLAQQVSNTTGLPDPLPPSEPASRHHRAPTHRAPATTSRTSAGQVDKVARPSVRPAAVAVKIPTSQLLTRDVGPRTTAPAVASAARIAPSSTLASLPAPLQNDTARTLFVAIATMILGALAGSHIKAAQEFVFAH